MRPASSTVTSNRRGKANVDQSMESRLLVVDGPGRPRMPDECHQAQTSSVADRPSCDDLVGLGHKRIDETMLYVHVAKAHPRGLPDVVCNASSGIADPDRRVLAMLDARGSRPHHAERKR